MTKLWLVPLLFACVACSTAEQPAPPPKFTGTDPCTLLQSGDLDQQLSGTPSKSDKACTYSFGETQVTVTLLAEQFEQASARLQSDGGYGAVIDDHPMTRRCKDASGTVTCEAVVDVRAGEVLGLKVVREDRDPNTVGQTTQGLAHKALGRLPVTS